MTISHWARPHSFISPDVTTDVVIVGGGYAGLSTAYWISEFRPDLKVTIIDRGQCGRSASGRNAGFLTKGSASFYKGLTEKWGPQTAQSIYKFAQESLELVHQNILKSSPEIKFERTSSMTLFQSEEFFKGWQNPAFNPSDFEFNWKNDSELSAGLKSKYFGCFENAPEYKINPWQLMDSLKKLLTSRKIQIIENLSGFQITEEGIKTEVNFIKAKQVVLALNGYFPEFDSVFKKIITPQRAQMLAVELEDELDCPGLYYDTPERVYWRKADEKVLVIGGKRLLDAENEVGDFEKLSSKIQAGLEDYLQTQLNVKYKVIHRWSGIMGFTEHELPMISKIEAPMETFMLGGFSGHGMGLGFRSGQEMAELVTGVKKDSFFDLIKSIKIKLC